METEAAVAACSCTDLDAWVSAVAYVCFPFMGVIVLLQLWSIILQLVNISRSGHLIDLIWGIRFRLRIRDDNTVETDEPADNGQLS